MSFYRRHDGFSFLTLGATCSWVNFCLIYCAASLPELQRTLSHTDYSVVTLQLSALAS